MAFPTSPVNGQTTTLNNITYTYVSATNAWVRNAGNISGVTSLTISGQATVGNLTTTSGVFWANGSAYSSGGGTTGNLVGQTSGNIFLTGNVLPTSNIAYDIGSTTQRFRSLYLSGNTIDLAGATIKTDTTTGAIALIAQPTLANPNPTGIVISPSGTLTTVATVAGTLTASAFSSASNTAVSSNNTSFANLTVSTTANVANLIVTNGVFWSNGSSYSSGGGGGTSGGTITVNMPNALNTPFVGTFRFYPTKTITLNTVYANLGGAPTGGNLGFAILKNGSNIGYGFSITTSNVSMAPVNISGNSISLTTSDYLTLNLTSTGVTASDLSVKITYT